MRLLRRSRIAVAVGLAATTLAACGGVSDPYNDRAGDGGSTAARTAPTPTTPRGPLQIDRGAGRSAADAPDPANGALDRAALSTSAARTIERYAQLSGTWTWRNVVARYRAAERISIGVARARVRDSAIQLPAVGGYQTHGVRQTTTVEAIVARSRAGDDTARYFVVQRRRIEMLNTPPSNQWFVSGATLRRVGDRWVVAQWTELV